MKTLYLPTLKITTFFHPLFSAVKRYFFASSQRSGKFFKPVPGNLTPSQRRTNEDKNGTEAAKWSIGERMCRLISDAIKAVKQNSHQIRGMVGYVLTLDEYLLLALDN